MSASLDQLRAALALDEEPGASVAVTDRMAGVHGHVLARRRRRAGALTAGVAALAVVAILATTSVVGQRRAEPPAHRPSRPNPVVNGLPLYAHGGRQIGSAQVALKAGVTHLFTTTPSSYGLTLAVGCGGSPGDRTSRWTLQVNGQDTFGTGAGSCEGTSTGESASGSGGFTAAAQHRYWASAGVRLGQPVSVDLVVDGTPSAGLTARVALYQEVPPAQYPLPDRPADVRVDPDFGLNLTQSREVRLPGGAATGSSSLTLPYDARLELGGVTTAPGRVEVHVGGQLVGGASSWTYSDNAFEVLIDPDALRLAGVAVPPTGTPTTITVTISGFADRTWQLRVGRSGRSQSSGG